MERTLTLNATYEPLCVVPLRRAVILVLNEKADTVETRDGAFRSATVTVEAPAVIRLRQFVKVPYRERPTLHRRAVIARDGGQCAYCPKPASTIDHVIPKFKGGRHVWENVVAACRRCNQRKGHKTVAEAGMTLRVTPFVPTGPAAFALTVGHIDDRWLPYIDTSRLTAGV